MAFQGKEWLIQPEMQQECMNRIVTCCGRKLALRNAVFIVSYKRNPLQHKALFLNKEIGATQRITTYSLSFSSNPVLF